MQDKFYKKVIYKERVNKRFQELKSLYKNNVVSLEKSQIGDVALKSLLHLDHLDDVLINLTEKYSNTILRFVLMQALNNLITVTGSENYTKMTSGVIILLSDVLREVIDKLELEEKWEPDHFTNYLLSFSQIKYVFNRIYSFSKQYKWQIISELYTYEENTIILYQMLFSNSLNSFLELIYEQIQSKYALMFFDQLSQIEYPKMRAMISGNDIRNYIIKSAKKWKITMLS